MSAVAPRGSLMSPRACAMAAFIREVAPSAVFTSSAAERGSTLEGSLSSPSARAMTARVSGLFSDASRALSIGANRLSRRLLERSVSRTRTFSLGRWAASSCASQYSGVLGSLLQPTARTPNESASATAVAVRPIRPLRGCPSLEKVPEVLRQSPGCFQSSATTAKLWHGAARPQGRVRPLCS